MATLASQSAREGAGDNDVPAALAHAPSAAPMRPILAHSGMTLQRFYSLHLAGATIPVLAALILYGWRALVVMLVVTLSALAAMAVWKRIGRRGHQLRGCHVLYLALLLSLTLPAHLATIMPPFLDAPSQLWAVLPASGILITALSWILGGVGMGRVHPVLVAYLCLVVLFKQALVPHWVLQRQHLLVGDPGDVKRIDPSAAAPDGWTAMPPVAGQAGLYLNPSSERLSLYTTGNRDQDWISLDSLLRDEMPPLEDLIIGGQPGPIGASSCLAVIVGGLFLLYRGVIDFRIPLLIVLTAFASFLVLRIPVVITDLQVTWAWVPMRFVGPAIGITFANYELMAGPLMFVAFFLATVPAVRPMSRRGRVIYALLIGVAAAAMQLYVSVSYGAYVALLVVSLLTPTLDKLFRQHPIV